VSHTHAVSPHVLAACTTGAAYCKVLQTDRISECWCLAISSRNLLDKWKGIEKKQLTLNMVIDVFALLDPARFARGFLMFDSLLL